MRHGIANPVHIQPGIIVTMHGSHECRMRDVAIQIADQTYAVGEVEISGPEDWATFITRYSRERSIKSTPHHGRSVLLGLQIIEIE